MYYKVKWQIVLCLFIVTLVKTYSQEIVFSGNVIDKDSGLELSFANIRVAETDFGTAADASGRFQLKLDPGFHRIIFSYIGYQSDTLDLDFNDNISREIKLLPVSLNFPEIVVLPGENPALRIIKKAIEYKTSRQSKIKTYTMNSVSKGIFRSTGDVSGDKNSVSAGIDDTGNDSTQMEIKAIFENYSKAYFRSPDELKEEIIARKQTANVPSTVNLLTGGRLIQNFYDDEIEFFGRKIPSPISETDPEYYFYFLQDSTFFNRRKVYNVYFAPTSNIFPAFYGNLFILDSLFALIKLDVNLNNAANPGRIFSKINVFQQFMAFDDSLYFPIDYRLFADGNVFGFLKFGLELNSLMYNYKINEEITEDKFDGAIISVLPEADEKKEKFWKTIQGIPSSEEESEAYSKIDSVKKAPKSFFEKISLLSPRTRMNDNLSIPGPMDIYHFNRVEGHALGFGLYINDEFNKRLNADFNTQYGFSDKRLKNKLSVEYLMGKNRTSSIYFSGFNKLTNLFEEDDEYNQFTTTVLNLFTKYDYKDYYYSNGMEFGVKHSLADYLEITAGGYYSKDKSASVNTNYSLFQKEEIYNANRPVEDTEIKVISAGFNFDFRDFIDDGYFRRRIPGKVIPLFSFKYLTTEPGFLKNKFKYDRFTFELNGRLATFGTAEFRYQYQRDVSYGTVPVQRMSQISGNIESGGKYFTYRTLKFGEVFGDNITKINIEHYFGDELFRRFHMGFLAEFQITLNSFINIAWSSISSKSKKELTGNFYEFKTPFVEAGFGLGHLFLPIAIEFAWKLNHRGHNNFAICLNTALM